MAKKKVAPPPLTLVSTAAHEWGFRQIIAVNKFGVRLKEPCSNPDHASSRIPGLDAEGCSKCKTWWQDEWYGLSKTQQDDVALARKIQRESDNKKNNQAA